MKNLRVYKDVLKACEVLMPEREGKLLSIIEDLDSITLEGNKYALLSTLVKQAKYQVPNVNYKFVTGTKNLPEEIESIRYKIGTPTLSIKGIDTNTLVINIYFPLFAQSVIFNGAEYLLAGNPQLSYIKEEKLRCYDETIRPAKVKTISFEKVIRRYVKWCIFARSNNVSEVCNPERLQKELQDYVDCILPSLYTHEERREL